MTINEASEKFEALGKSKAEALNFKRTEVLKLLNKCKPEEQEFFVRLYPEGLGNMNDKKLNQAFRQCYATLHKRGEV